MIRHLYVHIPFCLKICPYCSFYKEASDHHLTQRFLDALLRELEIESQRHELRPTTIFFGGGTPSALSVSQLDYLLQGMRQRLCLDDLEEWTFEMNPATVSLEKGRLLRGLGVNRVSMGVQSWDPRLLEVLGRVHSADQAERSYACLREAGFDNVNLDLMFAVPTQTRAVWADSLARTIALQPEHISAYCLSYEEDTAFFAKFHSGEFTQDSDWDADLFELTMDALEGGGYQQYEISNYARPRRQCLHNLGYWLGSDYLGLGPGAFSTCSGRRWQNIANTGEYTARIFDGRSAREGEEELDDDTRLAEKIAFSLRTSAGVERTLLHDRDAAVEEFQALGCLETVADRVVLTRKGRLLADAVAEAFV